MKLHTATGVWKTEIIIKRMGVGKKNPIMRSDLNHWMVTASSLPDLVKNMTRLELQPDDVLIKQGDDAELAALAHRILANNLSEKLSVANKTIQLAQS